MASPRWSTLPLLLALPLLMAHGGGGCGGDDDHDDDAEVGPPTGAVCPEEGTTLTYDNFAETFFSTYCTRCHSADVTGADREGAPSDHNFDTHFEAVVLADHIDQMAGAGPDSVNTTMPPNDGGDVPTEAERRQLSEWLACGGPPAL
jgi:uncharacterized membrane protein